MPLEESTNLKVLILKLLLVQEPQVSNYESRVVHAHADYNYLYLNDSGGLTNAYGNNAFINFNVNAGNASNVYGQKSYILNNSNYNGTLTNAYGLHSYVLNNKATSHITNSFGIYARVRNTTTGTSQNTKLFYGRMDGKHGTEYGLYLDDIHVEGNGEHITMKHYLEGNVGLGITNPGNPLAVQRSLSTNIAGAYFYFPSIGGEGNGMHIRAGGSSAGRYILKLRDAANQDRVTFLANGNVGIGTASPNAKLELIGNLRLSSYTGTNYDAEPAYYLGVDPVGNVIKIATNNSNVQANPEKTTSTKQNDNNIADLQNQVDELRSLVLDLTSASQSLETTIQVALENSIELETPYISQNMPNPTRSQAIIKYFIPEYATSATVRFFSMGGQVMKEVDIDMTGQGQLDVDLEKMISGSYMYALIIDGELVDTKTMIIVK